MLDALKLLTETDSNFTKQFTANDLLICHLGQQSYSDTLQAMQQYANGRSNHPDQIWLLQHPETYTKGRLSNQSDIKHALPHPLIDTDRGGKITYHGPGQLICYLLLHMPETQSIRWLTQRIDDIVLTILHQLAIEGTSDPKHRGIYAGERKIASVGVRIRKKCSYHGFSLNVDMDLSPFEVIKPCGREQKMTQTTQLNPSADMSQVIQTCEKTISTLWKKEKNIVIYDFES